MIKKVLLLSFFLIGSMGSGIIAQELTRILFVFDASNSMNGKWQSRSKIDLATQLLNESVDQLKGKDNLELALRVYGHQTSIAGGVQDCDDTKLEVSFGKYRHDDIKRTLQSITPKGTTPIARSLEKSANDFPEEKNVRNVIILITDGIEACDEDPCAVSRLLQKKGIVLKPFIIGIGIDDESKATFECVGNFFDATSEETFKNVLDIVITQALNNTTVQMNLLNVNDKPLETNIPMTFYDNHSGKILYKFVHTLNYRGVPDTLPIDPVYLYDVEIHTLPPVKTIGAKITPGIHNVIAAKCPQGDLTFKMDGRNAYKNLKCILKKNGLEDWQNIQAFEEKTRYLLGTYTAEILTLPITVIPDVNIAQSHTTTIEIPHPGVVNLSFPSPGYGSIFTIKNGKMVWVCNLDDISTQQQVVLQPGNYEIMFRSKNSKASIYTTSQNFEITSGSSTQIKF